MMAFGAKIKLTVDNSRASAFRREIQTYVNTATEKTPIYLHNVKITSAAKQSLLSDLKKYLNSDNTLVVKINSIDASGAISKLRSQLQTMLSGLSVTGLKEFLGTDGVDATYKKAAASAEKLAEATENVRQKGVAASASLQELKNVQSTLSSSFTNISKLETTDTTELLAEYERLNVKVQELRSNETLRTSEAVNGVAQETIALKQKIAAIIESENATKREAEESKKAAAQEAANSSRAISLKSQINRWILSNSKAYKIYGDQIDAVLTELDSEAAISKERLSQLRDKFKEIDTAARASGNSGNTFFDTFKKGLEKFGGWSLVTRSLMAVYRQIKQIVTSVRELDTAMTELKKVTDLTEQSYEKFIGTASNIAQTVGATLTDTVNATADFARLGYSLSEATELSKSALVYKNVGDGIDDINESTEALISTIKAFGIEAKNSMSIVDKYNEVGNNFAISSEGIGTALQKSASALASANNTLDESIALATGMNAVLQNPEIVGTALKTVSMYLRAAKTEAEEAGEATEGMANSVSELRSELLQLTHNKVDIMLDSKNYKSTYQILKELAAVWQDIADVDQANILELVGGKRNATAVTSLLNNFKDAQAALETAQTAAGSASAENEKYLDSINGKLDILQAKFETIANNLLDSGFVKFILDIATVLTDLLNLLSQFPLIITSIAASVAAISGALKLKELSQLTSRILLQKTAILEEKTVTDSLAASISALSAKQQQALVIQLQKKVVDGQITAGEYQQIIATTGLATAEKGLVAADGTLIAANHSLAASFKSLMASIPIWGWIALGISLIIELSTVIIDLVGDMESAEEKLSRLNDEFAEISESVKNISSNYSDLKKNADDIIPRFIELAKGVNEFGEKVSLTDEEYEEFISLNNKIAEMFPELDLGIDSNGNHILALSYSIDTLTESLKELVETERMAANEEIAGNMDDALDNIKSANKEYDKQISALKSRKSDYDEALKEINRMHSEQDRYKETYGDSWKDFYQLDTSNYVTQMQQAWGTIGNEIDAEAWRKMVDKYYIDEDSLEVDWYKVINSDDFKNAMAGLDREIDAIEKKQDARWKKLNPIMGSWLQTTDAYNAASDDVQDLMSKIIGNIDYSSINITDDKKLQKHIEENFIEPISNAKPEVQNAMVGLFDIKSAFDSGALTVGEYSVTDYILGDLQKSGVNESLLSTIKESLNLDEFNAQLDSVKSSIKGTDEEILKFVNDLTYNDFNLVYSVIQENGSMSIDELQEKIRELRYAGAEMVEPLNMSEFIDGLNETANAVDKVTSAMAKLAEGTELSKKEIIDLINQYPQLLQQADIFADGSVEAQKNALNSILDMQEQEYDAQIDAKIAELKATEQVLNNQLELEEQKANLIQDIKNMESNGKITQEKEFVDKLTELNQLQSKNYVSFKDGELQVNEEALNDQLAQETDYAEEAADNIWQPYGETIVQSHTQGYSGAMTATNNYITTLWGRIKNFFSNFGSAVSNAISDALSGNWKNIGAYFSQAIGTGSTKVSGGVVSVNFGSKNTTINGQSIDKWIQDQEKASSTRISKINSIKAGTVNAINNLEKLKGLDLTTIYGSKSTSSKSTKKAVDEYNADVDKFYDATKKLEDTEKVRKNLEEELSHTDDPAEKVKIYDKLVDAYKKEAEAEKDLVSKRKSVINNNVKALRDLGFVVEYDPKENRLLIKNLEHINDLTAKNKGKYESLQEATNALRKETEDLIDTTEDLNDANRDSIENIEAITYEIQDAAKEIVNCIEEVYKKQIDAYNDIIKKRKEAIESAKDEYDYEEEVANKVKEIADLQSRIDKLSLDNSREAQAQRNALIQELQEKQNDLSDIQSDHAYDQQLEALDKMAEDFEEQKNDELEIIKSSIGTVQELGTNIDQRITNAWNNAKRAVEAYGLSVAGLSGGVSTFVSGIPKYHDGGVVNGKVGKDEVLAILQSGEWVLNKEKQENLYEIIDFQTELANRLGKIIGSIGLPEVQKSKSLSASNILHNTSGENRQSIFNPQFQVTISHSGSMSDGDAKRYGEEIATTAIEKLYSAFERKGITNHTGSKLKP